MFLGTILALVNLVLPTLAAVVPLSTTNDVETRSLDELYLAAQKESRVLRVAWGGDIKTSKDAITRAFKNRFPAIDLKVDLDLSKYHEPRIDRHYQSTNFTDDGVDVAVLQTLHDFPRWKKQNRLLNYKVSTWKDIYPQFVDPEGAYTGLYIFSFGNIVYKQSNLDFPIPQTYKEFLDPKFSKGLLASAYPNDDDAILFLFVRIVQAYGWDFMKKFTQHNITYVRGTASPGMLIAKGNGPVISFACSSVFAPGLNITTPKDVHMAWPQTGAIFKSTKNPETAKLFLNFLMDDAWQKGPTSNGYATRMSHDRLGVFKQQPHMDPLGYGKFMADRRVVEWWRLQFEDLLGLPQGINPNLVDW